MATLTTLRNAVAKKLGLDNTTTGDQGLIDEWLNQGVLEILLRSHCTVESGSMAVIAATWEYQLDTSILAIDNLWKEDSGGALYLCVREPSVELFTLKRATGTAYDANVVHYVTRGSNLLLLWPTPSSAYTLKLHYVPRPTAMSGGTNDPSTLTYGRIPSEFHKLIEYWGLAEGADYDDDRDSGHGDRYRTLFEQGIKELRKAVLMKGGTRLSPVKVNPRRRIRASRDPSTDYGW